MLIRFVGIYSELGDGTRLQTFGQAVELTDDMVRAASLGGAEILPDDEFQAIGFTDQELKLWGNAVRQMKAPETFRAKYLAAREAARMFRQHLKENN
jgi:hypothetical protein